MATDTIYRVVHVVPYDGVGGVETAVRSMPAGPYGDIEFFKCFIARRERGSDQGSVHQGPQSSENHILNYFSAINHLMRIKPDVVIGSLWRSCLVLAALRFLRPQARFVTFLHLPSAVHFIDYASNRIAMELATEIWADSEATLISRVPNRLRKKGRVISFLTRRIPPGPIRPPDPSFIYWGRIDPQKGLTRALEIFAAVRRMLPAATFSIIGPDKGYGLVLRDLCKTLAIEDAMHFLGPKPWEEIRRDAGNHAFYLQTSEAEGMAMSVVEAMQLGLVPVVTPVGEIANYCTDYENSIVVRHDEDAVRRVCDLIADQGAYERLARNAQAYWQTQPLYRDSALAACRELAGRPL